eukprot:1103734-Amphidinium_carterae.1
MADVNKCKGAGAVPGHGTKAARGRGEDEHSRIHSRFGLLACFSTLFFFPRAQYLPRRASSRQRAH